MSTNGDRYDELYRKYTEEEAAQILAAYRDEELEYAPWHGERRKGWIIDKIMEEEERTGRKAEDVYEELQGDTSPPPAPSFRTRRQERMDSRTPVQDPEQRRVWFFHSKRGFNWWTLLLLIPLFLLLIGSAWVSGNTADAKWRDNWYEQSVEHVLYVFPFFGTHYWDMSPDWPEGERPAAFLCEIDINDFDVTNISQDEARQLIEDFDLDVNLDAGIEANLESLQEQVRDFDESRCDELREALETTVQPEEASPVPTEEEPEPTETAEPTATEAPTVAPTQTPEPTVVPTEQPTATAVPTQAPTEEPVILFEDDCDLDGINMMNQIQDAGRQRVEVGGENNQVIVYYTEPGELRVTYIIGPQETPRIWYGYGQMWEERTCSDLIDWAEQHTIRHDHSGIIVDLRDGEIYNEGDLSDAEVDELIAEQEEFINGN